MGNEVKEKQIRTYFKMWVKRDFSGIDLIFDKTIFYRECYGACYRNIEEIPLWIKNQLKKQIVQSWIINDFYFSVDYVFVTWTFRATEEKPYVFDGISKIKFNQAQKISEITEYETANNTFYPF